ncbi:MAG TPA: serine hydrolase [Elusimicrobiota bacterium]|nr:serine hydrolase [Elusimicrobiota bacterium]
MTMLPALFGVVVLAAVAAGVRRFLRVAAVGAAYKTKALCSALFVSGLEFDDTDRAPEVSAEAYRLMSLFPARVDREKKTVTASFSGLSERTAVWRPGLGATIAFKPVPPAPTLPQPRRLDAAEPWPEGEAPSPAPSPALERVLDSAFAETRGASPRRTRAVVVVQDGRVVAERYAPGFSHETPLNGWSMSKSVLGTLIGTLVGEGRLALSDKALLAEWAGAGDARANIAVEDLLRMRSGLEFAEVYSNPLSDVTRMLFDCPDAGGFAASRPLAAQPGTAWKYASGTTNILSMIARRKLGEDAYPSWPRRALFDPLGMSSAVFEQDASGTFIGSSFLFATARDWARFGLLHAQDGVWDGRRVLPEGWVKLVTTPTPQSPDLRYGAHWWLKLSKELGGEGRAAAALPSDAFHALGHEGQCLTVIPSRGLVAVRLGLSIDITAWDQAAFLADLLAAL